MNQLTIIALMMQRAFSGAVDTGDNIANSIMLDSSASQYLSRTVTTSATFTFACVFKRGKLGVICPLLDSSIKFNANDTLTVFGLTTTAVYRDPTAWLFIHVSNGGLYVNGVSQGAVTTSALTNPRIGFDGTNYADGYMAMNYIVDGTSDPYTNYGRSSVDTTQWVNKNASPTYGAKGSLLNFTNSGALGTDSSGNGNNWTLNGGITSANQYADTPTNNYCVLNILNHNGASSLIAKKGNLTADNTGAGSVGRIATSLMLTSGKWQFEVTRKDALGIGNIMACGVVDAAAALSTGVYTGAPTNTGASASEWMITDRATACNNTTYTDLSGTLGTIGQNAVTRIFIDVDAHKIWFGVGAVISGDPTAGTGAAFSNLPAAVLVAHFANTSSGAISEYNFGAKTPTYSTHPTFKQINTANLPEGTAAAPANFTGNAAADGAYIAMNGTPETATINSNAVTWGTHADRVAGGMKLRTASASYNASGSNTLSCTFLTPNRKSVQKYQTAKGNP